MKDDPNLWLYTSLVRAPGEQRSPVGNDGLLPTINEAWDSSIPIEQYQKSAPDSRCASVPEYHRDSATGSCPNICCQRIFRMAIPVDGFTFEAKGGSPKASPPNLNEDEAFELYGRLRP